MLREPIATRRRRIAGNAAVVVLASAAAFAAWASQPSAPQDAGADQPVARYYIHPEGDFSELRLVPPVYPRAALEEGAGGTVNLIIDIAADGRITGVSVENAATADPRFVAAAAKNAWDWKFKPRIKDGKPVAGRVRVPITFSPVEPKTPGQA